MKRRVTAALAVVFMALAATACIQTPVGQGSFDKTLTVTGPLTLEVENGSGKVLISAGNPGQVRIHGEFRVNASLWDPAEELVEEFRKAPPIEQHGNVVRIERFRSGRPNVSVSVDYTLVVPPSTELRASVGSGELDVRDIQGGARLRSGSGDVTARNLGGDAEVRVGSGDIHLDGVAGALLAGTGSGDMRLRDVHGDVRANTGSGDIELLRPGGRVSVRTGSGDVAIREAKSDLEIHTGSGNVTADGNPAPRSFWDLRTSSGEVDLDLPRDASVQLLARWRSGGIQYDLPLEITERSKRELRGRLGKGEARVSVETGSGRISLH